MFKELILKIIIFYQNFIFPNLGKFFRFYPNCSEYSYQGIEKYGVFKGLFRKRLLKGHLLHQEGIDLP